jgi:hypothetical protein
MLFPETEAEGAGQHEDRDDGGKSQYPSKVRSAASLFRGTRFSNHISILFATVASRGFQAAADFLASYLLLSTIA